MRCYNINKINSQEDLDDIYVQILEDYINYNICSIFVRFKPEKELKVYKYE